MSKFGNLPPQPSSLTPPADVSGSSDQSIGVKGVSNSGTGVLGTCGSGTGVVGTSSTGDGVFGESGSGISIHGKGVKAGQFDGEVTVNGVLSANGSLSAKGDISVGGNVVVAGDITFSGSDCAEDIDAALDIEPGSVVVIDYNGRLRECESAYDKKVAGVVSGAGALKPAIILGKGQEVNALKVPLALTGRVYCKVDAKYSPVEIGDLLTTSSTPGFAMRATDPARSFGSVLGKAMGRLDSGRGLVPVLIALQ